MSENSRVISLDIMRGGAIFFMIAAHIPFIFLNWNQVGSFLAAPLFLFSSGMSISYYTASRKKKKVSDLNFKKETLFKALLIYVVPLIPYIIACILIPQRFQFTLIHWGIFQVIAIGYVLACIIPDTLKNEIFTIIGVAISTITLSLFMPSLFSIIFPEPFAFLPWIIYFLFGKVAYHITQTTISRDNFIKVFVAASIAFIFLFIKSNEILLIIPASLRGNGVVMLQLSLIFFLGFLSLYFFLDIRKRKSSIFEVFENIGRIAFSSYYIHLALIFALTPIIGIILNESLDFFILFFVCLCVLYYIEKYWRPFSYRFGIEWLIRTIPKYILSHFDSSKKQDNRCN